MTIIHGRRFADFFPLQPLRWAYQIDRFLPFNYAGDWAILHSERKEPFSASLRHHLAAEFRTFPSLQPPAHSISTSRFGCAMSLRRHKASGKLSHMFDGENCVGLFIKISIRIAHQASKWKALLNLIFNGKGERMADVTMWGGKAGSWWQSTLTSSTRN